MAKETKHNTSRGILLVALGAPEYGYMAANLAASIRHSDSEVNIHLVYAGKAISHFTAAHKALFSSMAECPAEYYTRGTRDEGRGINDPATDKQQQTTEYIKAKTHIYELTPYEETLFLDVDMYILPSVRMSQVLNALSASCSYTI